MTVVRNEFELGENSPMEALSKEIWSAAFMAHPYHHDTIGWRSDIEYVPIEKLRAFYDTFYWPDNATVTVIGGFDVAATLEEIKEHYGPIPKSPHPFPALYTVEPRANGPAPRDGEALGRSGHRDDRAQDSGRRRTRTGRRSRCSAAS